MSLQRYSQLTERMVAAGRLKQTEANNPLIILLRLACFPIVRFSLWFNIHPNVVTILSLGLGCSGAWFYAVGAKVPFVAAWSVAVVLDYADGIVARMAKKESYFGYLLDMLGDRVKLITLLAAWAYAVGSQAAVWLAAACVASLLATEIVAHVLVRHANQQVAASVSIRTILYEIFAKFDMDTFLVLGVLLLLPGNATYVGPLWLLIVLLIGLGKELCNRCFANGVWTIALNTRLVGRIEWLLRRSG
jgi:phosphatidylglycerophosphate synthase